MTVMPQNLSLLDIDAVVIGASAGAIASLSQLLPPLTPDYPLPILVTVHVPSDQPNGIPSLLQAKCRVTIKEAEDKEYLSPGTVYFAPPDYHVLVERDRSLSLSNEEPVSFARPSIDVLFESAADVYGKTLLALVLSGANHDGARGACSVVKAGGTVRGSFGLTVSPNADPAAPVNSTEDVLQDTHLFSGTIAQNINRAINHHHAERRHYMLSRGVRQAFRRLDRDGAWPRRADGGTGAADA